MVPPKFFCELEQEVSRAVSTLGSFCATVPFPAAAMSSLSVLPLFCFFFFLVLYAFGPEDTANPTTQFWRPNQPKPSLFFSFQYDPFSRFGFSGHHRPLS